MYYHGVVPRGSNIRRRLLSQEGCFSLAALKPETEMVSEASRGRYDFDKPENITDLYRQSNHQDNWETIRAGLKAQDPASCRVLSPIV